MPSIDSTNQISLYRSNLYFSNIIFSENINKQTTKSKRQQIRLKKLKNYQLLNKKDTIVKNLNKICQ